MKQKVFIIDEAISEIQKYHDNSRYRPLLVGVYGCGQNAGDLFFCKKVCRHLHDELRFDVYWTDDPSDLLAKGHHKRFEYLFYYNRPYRQIPIQNDIANRNMQIMPFTERCMDVNVAIFNPKFLNPDIRHLTDVFDIVIPNPHTIPIL